MEKLDKSNSYGIENAHLVILCGTKEFLPKIRKILMNVGVKKEDYTLINPLPSEVPDYLLLGDVGLHLESMAIATPYGIAIKDGEYLASGLPVICTPWQSGIAPLIERYHAGIVVELTQEGMGKEELLLKKYNEFRENGFKFVEEYLELKNCVKRFLELYK